jgi:mannan endo-1,4-beta-mannosidase
VAAELVDPKATDRAKRLMQYMADIYGEYTISGQYGDMGILGPEFIAINNATGEFPAMLGLDFIEYTPSRVANGSIGRDVDYALRFNQEGGIITFAWHWNAPEPYLINSSDNPWWKGFYTEGTTINLKKIMDGEDQEGYDLLIRDIDAIAEQLKRLQKADIPILWRPLHEASGGWFWWGATGPQSYIKLYQLLFDRLTNYHDIHNLIWVWNGQNKDWYPGDEYVDIVGTDVYPGQRIYSSQSTKFNELIEWNGDSKKIIAMTENGCLFDPELAARDNAMWSYFGTWEGEFLTLNNTYTLSEKYTETKMLIKVYTSKKVITLDELPDLKTYGE